MNFELTEEQAMVRDMVQKFAKEKIAPFAKEWDEKCEFPRDVIKELGELGMMGIIFPQEYGGAGMDYITYATVVEELSRYDGSVGITVASHTSLCSNHIYISGTEEQKKKYLVPLAKGEKLGAWAITEPDSGSDAGAAKSTAVLDGDSWVLNGSKMFITQGTVADIYIIIAVTDKSRGTKGLSAFIVEKGTPGFSSKKIKGKLGLHASDTAELYMENVRIPKENLLGKLNEGFIDSMKVLDGGRISIAAMALGIARGCLEESIKYSKERTQFNQPISNFQAIQWKLVDMAIEIEAARLLVLKAAQLKDENKRVTKESAMAKVYCAEVGMRAATQAIQIHGGYGYINEYPVERYFRDIKLCEIGEGTSEIQRLVIARALLS